MPRPLSIRTHLFGLVAVVALPLGALETWNLKRSVDDLEREAREQVLYLAQVTAANTAALLAQAHNILRGFAARPMVRALDPSRCDPLLKDFLTIAPRFANVATMTLDGAVVCSAVPAARGARMNPELLLKLLRGPGELTVGKISPGTVTGRWVMPVGQRLPNGDGRTAGAIGLAIDLASLRVLPSLQGLPELSVTWLMALDGTVLARSREAERFVGTKVGAGHPAVRGTSGTAELKGVDGIARIQGFVPVPGTDWMAIASVPADAVYAPVRERFVRDAAIFATLLLAVLLLAHFLARRISNPVRAIADTARAIAGGDAAARAPEAGPTEIVRVGREMNRMLDNLRRGEAGLRDSEERYRRIVETTLEGICTMDQDYRISFVNNRFAELLGYRPEELVGRRPMDFLDEESRARGLASAERRRMGEAEQLELTFLKRDGTPLHGLLSSSSLIDAQGRFLGAVGMLTDVTALRAAERTNAAQLRDLRRWYEATLGREDRVRELKQEVNALRARLGETPPYADPAAGPERAKGDGA